MAHLLRIVGGVIAIWMVEPDGQGRIAEARDQDSRDDMIAETPNGTATRFAAWTGVGLGIGIAGSLDEIVFHQLLQWHNFYVHTDAYWRAFSDGLFHIFTAAMLFFGAVRLWRARRRTSEITRSYPFWGGILVGAGAFQLFDGTVNHKLLQLHPVREGADNILLYDIAWNAPALLLLLVGWLVLTRSRKGTGQLPTHGSEPRFRTRSRT